MQQMCSKFISTLCVCTPLIRPARGNFIEVSSRLVSFNLRSFTTFCTNLAQKNWLSSIKKAKKSEFHLHTKPPNHESKAVISAKC